jgi:hypothetical protein
VVSGLSEPDRLREYERRLQTARKAGCDIGNINARTIDHWHRAGWYDLFYRRSVVAPLMYHVYRMSNHIITTDGTVIQQPQNPSRDVILLRRTRVAVMQVALMATTTMTHNSTSLILSR